MRLPWILVLALTVACNLTAAPPAQVQTDRCRSIGETVRLPGLGEASGITASRRTPGLLWAHNDSGDPAVYALDLSGSIKHRVLLAGAAVDDWEDIAIAACPGGSCLYVADIGDNGARRRRITIYRVPEPELSDKATQPVEAFHATYPDGSHDAEALFVLPSGDLFIVTKNRGAWLR